MKTRFFILGVLWILSSCTNPVKPPVEEAVFKSLLEAKSYLKLSRKLEKDGAGLPEEKLSYYKAFVYKASGKHEASNAEIELLAKKYRKTFEDSVWVRILDLQAANYIYQFEYGKAAEIYHEILNRYSAQLDSSDIENYKNVVGLFGALKNEKPQALSINGNSILKAYRNRFNHLMTPVQSGGKTAEFIFDTGANLSTITVSQAREMALKPIGQSVEIGSATSVNVQTQLAIADSLQMGNMIFRNVVFLVVPDAQMRFPEMNYEILGIIGFPVIYQMGEIQLLKTGEIQVIQNAEDRIMQNLFLDGLNPVVELISNNDTLLFTVDTGARTSELSMKYYREHKLQLDKLGEKKTGTSSGVGGTTAVEEIWLRNLTFRLGQNSVQLDSIPVTLEEYGFNRYFDGNLGQDFLSNYKGISMNFRSMSLSFIP